MKFVYDEDLEKTIAGYPLDTDERMILEDIFVNGYKLLDVETFEKDEIENDEVEIYYNVSYIRKFKRYLDEN